MPATTKEVKFSCASCRREFRWKPELAGKQAKCKCGSTISIPRTPPPPPPPADDAGGMDDLYALAAEEKATAKRATVAAPDEHAKGYRCPSCGSSIPVGSMVCAQCTLDLRTGAKSTAPAGGARGPSPAFGYAAAHRSGVADAAAAKRRSPDDMLYEGGKAISLYLPLGLITLGILFYFGAVAFSKEKMGAALMVAFVGIRVAMDAGLMLVAMIIAVKTMDMGFGAFGPAVLKIIAIAVGPGALGAMVGEILPGSAGLIAGGVLSLVLYYTLIKVLFNLDLGETLMLVGIIYAVQRWLGTFLFIAIFALIASGLPGGDKIADVAITAALADESSIGEEDDDLKPPSPEEIREEHDDLAQLVLNSVRGGTDAAEWLSDGTRSLSKMDPAQSQAFVKSLLSAGAKKVSITHIDDNIPPYGVGTQLVVELPAPTEKAARKKILDMYAKWVEKWEMEDEEVPEDVGQTYLIWELPSPYPDEDEEMDEEDEPVVQKPKKPAKRPKAPAPAAPASKAAAEPEAAPAEGEAQDAGAAEGAAAGDGTAEPAAEPAPEAPATPEEQAPAFEGEATPDDAAAPAPF